MEAVGSGLGIIGLDVYYGNTTFIKNNVNGYRVPIDITNWMKILLITELSQVSYCYSLLKIMKN